MKTLALILGFLTCHCIASESICHDILAELFPEKDIHVSIMQSGLSQAQLFLGQVGSSSYVVRLLPPKPLQDRQREIQICHIASAQGYGPKVYGSNIEKGYIVMEYVSGQPGRNMISSLAALAKKIHAGPHFPTDQTIFEGIAIRLEKYLSSKKACGMLLPSYWLDEIVSTIIEIQKVFSKHGNKTPCHRDLHVKNILFSQGNALAIDYEYAAEDDPFIDLATLSLSYDFSQQEEQELLVAYLADLPQDEECAKLFLAKQLIRIYWAFDLLNLIPDPMVPKGVFLTEFETTDRSYRTFEGKLFHAKRLIDEMLRLRQSEQYTQAIALLS